MTLRAFNIKYMPRTSIKGQVLADLVAEFAEHPKEIEVKRHGMDEKSVGLISTQDPHPGEYMWMKRQTSKDQEWA